MFMICWVKVLPSWYISDMIHVSTFSGTASLGLLHLSLDHDIIGHIAVARYIIQSLSYLNEAHP